MFRRSKVEFFAFKLLYLILHSPRHDEGLPNKVNFRKESTHKVANRSAAKTSIKTHLRILTIQLGPGKTERDRAKLHYLIRKEAVDYEAKRVHEAERKRKEREARAKGSSPGSLPS